jgi:hypothetical protein
MWGMTAKRKSDHSDVEDTGEYNADPKEPTDPAPLPPSPGNAQVEGWFDSQPTFTDPRMAKKRVAREIASEPLAELSVTRAHGESSTGRGLLVLVAAASLAVGVLVGAIAFGQFGAAGGAADCECAEK